MLSIDNIEVGSTVFCLDTEQATLTAGIVRGKFALNVANGCGNQVRLQIYVEGDPISLKMKLVSAKFHTVPGQSLGPNWIQHPDDPIKVYESLDDASDDFLLAVEQKVDKIAQAAATLTCAGGNCC